MVAKSRKMSSLSNYASMSTVMVMKAAITHNLLLLLQQLP